ncbi:MAG: nucleotide exchange factor GrpE [Clostridiaceae bacterium]
MDKFTKKHNQKNSDHPHHKKKPTDSDFIEENVKNPEVKDETSESIETNTHETEAISDTEATSQPNEPNNTAEAESEPTAPSQQPKEEDMTENTARTIEVDEEEMLFTRRKIKNLQDETKKLTNEVEAYKERLLRITSEYENFRKRTSKEKDEIGADATVGVLRDILPIIDNLERALVTETDDLPGLKEGVQMTLDQFVAAMQKMGVELIPTDEGFDPELHDAVMHEVDETKGARVVSEVFLKGYKKDDKVVRHAVVKVAN